MKRVCRHCHEDLSHVPPTDAMTRHIVGLCTPSHNEVDAALTELEEAEKQRTRKALEYVNAQRRPMVVTGKDFLWFAAKLLFWFGVVAAFVIGWLSL